MLFAASVHQDERVSAKNGYHGVYPAVIVQIAKSQTATRDGGRDSRDGAFETAILIQGEQRWLEIMQRVIDGFHVIEHVTLRDEQVLPAIVVEIFQAYAPA